MPHKERPKTVLGKLINIDNFEAHGKTWQVNCQPILVIEGKRDYLFVNTEGIGVRAYANETVRHPSTKNDLFIDLDVSEVLEDKNSISMLYFPCVFSADYLSDLAEKSDNVGDLASHIRKFGDRLEQNYHIHLENSEKIGAEIIDVEKTEAA